MRKRTLPQVDRPPLHHIDIVISVVRVTLRLTFHHFAHPLGNLLIRCIRPHPRLHQPPKLHLQPRPSRPILQTRHINTGILPLLLNSLFFLLPLSFRLIFLIRFVHGVADHARHFFQGVDEIAAFGLVEGQGGIFV